MSAPREGARVWLIPDGHLPVQSSGEQVSHEAICVLNSTGEDAALSLTFYFEDREPIRSTALPVTAERTRHFRLDRPQEIGGVEIPRGVPYAMRVESSVPVSVQYSRLDTSQSALALMTSIAFPVA